MTRCLYRVLQLTVFGIMISSLYLMDRCLGKGFTVGMLRILTKFKYFFVEYASHLPPFKGVLDVITNGNTAVSILISEISVFAAVMMLLNRSRLSIENRVDKFLLQSRGKLEETYAIIEKWKKQKISSENCSDNNSNGRSIINPLNDNIPFGKSDRIAAIDVSTGDAASGDCACTAAERHQLYPSAEDFIRITGQENDDIEQIFGSELDDRILYDLVEDDVTGDCTLE